MEKVKGCAQSVWAWYMEQWKMLKGWKLFLFYMLHYTLLFAVVSHYVFLSYENAGKSFIAESDGMANYFTGMIRTSQTIRNGIQALLAGKGWTFPLYDFCSGSAKSGLEMEPIQWLAVLWPWDRIDVLYDVLVLLRYYLVGLSFSVFGFYFGQSPVPVMIGAVSYTFCGFTLYAGVRHPFFGEPTMLLPLLIIGTEKVLKKERPFFLISMVFLAIISSLYFACMLAVIVALYALVRFFTLYEENCGREFAGMIGRLAVGGGIGIMLGGVVMLPTLLQMVGTGRIGRDVADYIDWLKYPDSYYKRFVTNYILAGTKELGYWSCVGSSVLVIPAILLLFIRRRKEERSLRLLYLERTR